MIRNYENPEGTISLVDSTSISVPVKVFTSSTTGGPIAGGVTGRTNAITTMAFCNTGAASLIDETDNQVIVNVYIVKNGRSYTDGNKIISELIVPAGETVFFAEERMVLESGDEVWVGTSAASLLSVTISVLEV
jgi:hypothetical protein